MLLSTQKNIYTAYKGGVYDVTTTVYWMYLIVNFTTQLKQMYIKSLLSGPLPKSWQVHLAGDDLVNVNYWII